MAAMSLKSLARIGRPRKSVNSVVRKFNRAAKELETVVAQDERRLAAEEARIAAARARLVTVQADRDRALRIKDRFAAFVE